MTLDKLFGWFFKLVRGFYNILDKTLSFDIGGLSFSFWDILCVFMILSLVISALIKSGGVTSDV